MSLRTAMLLGVVAAVVGIGLLAAQAGRATSAVGAMLFGIGGVVLVSGAFYAIGRSEDRDRAARRSPPPPDDGPGSSR